MVKQLRKVINWEEPPAPRPQESPLVERWQGVVAELVAKPETWGLIEVTNSRSAAMGLVSLINKQRLPFNAGPFEGTNRFRGASHFDKDRELYKVYARYEEKKEEAR